MNFNFGEILSRAWKITWKYKILWIFGILSSCSRGGGSFNFRSSGGGNRYNPSGLDPERLLNQAGDWLSHNWWVAALIVAALIVLTLIAIFLGAIGRIGLIRGTLQAEESAERLSFGELFKGSMPYFWRVFGLAFLIGLISLLALLPFFAFGILTAGIGFLCLLPLLCLLIPVSIALYLIIEMANVAIVKENVGLVEGFKRGWEVARGNAGPVLIMGLILLVISFVVGLVIAVPVLMIVAPAMFSVMLNQGQSMTPLLIGGLCFVMFLPVAILIGGILNTFVGASWTLTYLRLTSKPEEPAIIPTEANA